MVKKLTLVLALFLILGVNAATRTSTPTWEKVFLPLVLRRNISTKIAFVSLRDGNAEIYVMDADGSDQTRLTYNSEQDQFPAWGPNKAQTAFVCHRNTNPEICLMDADGANQIRLTNRPGQNWFPVWSPNGTQIAFIGNNLIPGGWASHYNIYVMDADGSNLTQLTSEQGADYYPSWSPDGTRIAFESEADRDVAYTDLYIMEADGSNPIHLTRAPPWVDSPTWSPSGQQVAFSSYVDSDYGREIFVINTDGTGKTRPTYRYWNDSYPAWSPDGTAQVNLTNGLPVSLTYRTCRSFSWSPDGTRIVFPSSDDGDSLDIYVANVDGSAPIRMTNSGVDRSSPAWSPRTR